MSKNILIINGKEEEVSSEHMRDFYESAADMNSTMLVNKINQLKEMSKKLKKAEKQIEVLKEEIKILRKYDDKDLLVKRLREVADELMDQSDM